MPDQRIVQCSECPKKFEAAPTGRTPVRCPECRKSRPHRKAAKPKRRGTPLRVVRERPGQPRTEIQSPPPPPPGPASASGSLDDIPGWDEAPARAGSVRAAVQSSFSGMPVGNPAEPALQALAVKLAGLLDAGVDERSVPTFVRELRATLADLRDTGAEADEDDPFGFGSMSATVVDPQAG